MGIIRKLPDTVANKIAAGEVVERPASVVKEIVENSIDAESSRIEVELEDGGKRLIRVSDNGTGIAPDDLDLAVESHATSKLKDSNDLFFITTLGFRGEALPSIGAVAELRIASRVRGADAGAEVEVIGGKKTPVKAAGVPEGTIIEVRNLFFNIPARRKFLKTSSTELSHAVDIITKMALAYPSVSFRLVHNGREVVSVLQNEDRLRRIASFFGKDLHDGLLEVNSGSGPLTIHGYVAPPSITRANAKLQYIFLNGRFIRDKTVASAIRDAYAGTLPAGKHPVVVLFLQIDPREVDVNVHPTKYEVRFRDSHLIYSGVRRMISERLGKTSPPAPSPSLERGEEAGPTSGDGTRVENGEEDEQQQPAAPGRSAVSADWSRKIGRDPA
ncbi:MAG TPA: DNA mismatch repair endonuclease MutL, partial [Planctomycetota bacterium]|nr:DNA mismatch repair endonuclease MutL [Planctomycetota bacterium]